MLLCSQFHLLLVESWVLCMLRGVTLAMY